MKVKPCQKLFHLFYFIYIKNYDNKKRFRENKGKIKKTSNTQLV